MINHLRFLLCLLLISSVALAQDEFAPVKPPPKPAPGAEPEVQRREALAVQTIRESNPKTAEQLLRAAEMTLDFDRPDEAQRYLTQLLDAKPAAAALVKAHQQIGSAFLIRIGREATVQPQGAQVADLILKTAHAAAFNPKRIEQLVNQLNSPDVEKRQQSLSDLQYVGADAFPALLAVLSQDARAAEHDRVKAALLALAGDATGPIVAALDSPKETLRRNVLPILGELRSSAAFYRLLRPAFAEGDVGQSARQALTQIAGGAPSKADAEKALSRRIEALLDPESGAARGVTTVWTWDAKADVPRQQSVPGARAALLEAARLAADLAAIAPENVRYQRLALLTGLEQQQTFAGLDAPLPIAALNAAKQAPVALLADTLAEAVHRNRPAAMLAVLNALADAGDASLLQGHGEQVSPVVALLRHTDRRVRYAALQAVVHWAPEQPFAGTMRVAEAIEYFLSSTGRPKALVVYPREEYGLVLAALLAESGYDTDAVVTPQQFMKLATNDADYEFVMISEAVDHPRVNELIQWMGRDYRSKELPVAIMYRDGYQTEYENKYRLSKRVAVVPRLHADEPLVQQVEPTLQDPRTERVTIPRSTAASQVRRIQSMFGPEFVPAAERLNQAYGAAELAHRIMQNPKSALRPDLGRMENALIENVSRVDMTSRTAPLLAAIGSAHAQTTLVNLASQSSFPLEARRAAAEAFAAAVQKRGIMLTQPQIREQYERYNASETADAETQQVLGSLLDAIESRTKRVEPAR